VLINIDEIVTGALVNAISAAGRRLSVALGSLPRRRRSHDVTVARWFGTYELTREPPAIAEDLADTLRGDEVQAALQELLAARLTDAPEADAIRAREVLRLTLGASPEAATLADYYDDEICALVARLEADDAPMLAQIRAEAFATRMISILNAIERHTAALKARPGRRTEADFVVRYRRHVREQHGKLEPPDFDRRRRVPLADIYVPTRITKTLYNERTVAQHSDPESLAVWQLATELDRTVLLGDPGGGKTTAATVLMHHFASSAADGRVPFLVTLRDYAAKDPPVRSIVGHIEHTLDSFYQSPGPPGLVDLLLLTGRAVVIFDGLDELIDTTRRADVSARVEHFCTEYPLTPVLVTSRATGYDQARLDDRQFTCYRLEGFSDEQVAEFVRKWFAQDADAQPAEAESFLAESETIPDLCANPLMLALLCILYRGAGSLPRNRAEIYEQCATLLFRRWDARRHIDHHLRAGHQLEPALRHLAWWLFTRENTQSAVAERDLVGETTKFLHGRGFESEDDARDAAREFVEFCRGRMWVLTDTGTTASGEKLYAFTHRTFLEYFAAAHLAYASDTPEQLAGTLAPRVAVADWTTMGELTVQIKDRTSEGGAQRVFDAMFETTSSWNPRARINVLVFLARCLRSVHPPPGCIRELTRHIVNMTPGDLSRGYLMEGPVARSYFVDALPELLAACDSAHGIVADEIEAVVSAAFQSGAQVTIDMVHRLIALVNQAGFYGMNPFWESRLRRVIREHSPVMIAAAREDINLRTDVLRHGLITARQAIEMSDGLAGFFRSGVDFIRGGTMPVYLERVFLALLNGWPAYGLPPAVDDLVAVGEYLQAHPEPPWLHGPIDDWTAWAAKPEEPYPPDAAKTLSDDAWLGAAAIVSIVTEKGEPTWPYDKRTPDELGPLRDLLPYLNRRAGTGPGTLPDLPVPEKFKQVFRDWAEGRIDLTAPVPRELGRWTRPRLEA
jgi:hypothetical protein